MSGVPIQTSLFYKVKKTLRFVRIYGPRRAMVKAMGRMRLGIGLGRGRRGLPGAALVGCGQFAFSTIAYFLPARARLAACFDIDPAVSASFGRLYGIPRRDRFSAVLEDPSVDLVYIASNHASHAGYAVEALDAGKRVYVEKPVAVDLPQLADLAKAARRHGPGRLFAGYNRPYSGAVRELRSRLPAPRGPMTLSCFISGHQIPADHWYRRPGEGTRICGNVGHWLDLAVHMISWRSLPDRWRISLSWSDPNARDDDLAICLASEGGDLVNIVLTARTEPFEGINETLNLQWDGLIAKIDDFRRMTIWRGDMLRHFRYWPKDVGHKRAILQPFTPDTRAWSEVELSTLLMLHITEMVVAARNHDDFSFGGARAALAEKISG